MTPRTGLALLALAAAAACTSTQAKVLAPPSPTPAATHPRATHHAKPRPAITIAFAGDVHFEGSVRRHLLADPATTFGDVAPLLRSADLTIVNLETAVTDRGTAVSKQFVFRAPASAYTALTAAGVDVASVANNHGMDYGQVGLADTLTSAKAHGFPLVGAGVNEAAAFTPYRVRVKGWEVSVIGATQVLDSSTVSAWTAGPRKPGLASANQSDAQLLAAVRKARRTSDTVIVYLHWGKELQQCPTSRQQLLAQELVDAGADIVVGSHAHVVLGSGHLGSAYVDYGLGNFLFYASGTGPTTLSSVLTLHVHGRTVTAARRDPVVLRNGWTSRLAGQQAQRELQRQDALRSCTALA